MYANGTGVEQDIDEAIRWLQRAAAQGDKIAAENLATLGAR
jgi:TPR repeat protein